MNITCIVEDMTKISNVDAIVNSTNNCLHSSYGLNKDVHRVAGPKLFFECLRIGRCHTGEAVLTKGYGLPCKYIIHVVGPKNGAEGGQEELLLRSAYWNALELALQHNIRTIAIPQICTGHNNFPKDQVAYYSIDTIKIFCTQYPDAFDEVFLVSLTQEDKEIVSHALKESDLELRLKGEII